MPPPFVAPVNDQEGAQRRDSALKEVGMKVREVVCPRCGTVVEKYLNPVPTVDIVIATEGAGGEKGIVLIYRRNEPRAWSLPGGFVDLGETLESAAVREAREETGLAVELLGQLHTYSDPRRDLRQHTISTVFAARTRGNPVAGDDAQEAGIFTEASLPRSLAFDHEQILRDYFRTRAGEKEATGITKTGEKGEGGKRGSGVKRKKSDKG